MIGNILFGFIWAALTVAGSGVTAYAGSRALGHGAEAARKGVGYGKAAGAGVKRLFRRTKKNPRRRSRQR